MSDTSRRLRLRLFDAVRDYGIAQWRLGVDGSHPGPSSHHDSEGMDAWRRVGVVLDEIEGGPVTEMTVNRVLFGSQQENGT